MSVSTQLKDFINKEAGWYNSGALQRMTIWKNDDGTTATGKSVSRRLQELAESKEIQVDIRNGSAWYARLAEPKPQKPKKIFIVDLPEGRKVIEVPV